MELIVATHQLAHPGGAQTYAITVAEHLARLGHGVTLVARELGASAELARARGLTVAAGLHDLPARADGVLTGVDRSLAFALARRYPDAARLFVVHGADDVHLPPPLDDVVHATVVLNDRLGRLAAAAAGAGRVVRLRQPVDLRRFSPRGTPADRPRRVVLLGNYHDGTGSRVELLRRAWGEDAIAWALVGGRSATTSVAEAMAGADVVVGYGRSVLEAMACGRPAYVFDHAGSDGWVTPDSYARLEADGFAGATGRAPGLDRLRADLAAYRPELGRQGQDLARAHHDARDHAAALVALLEEVAPPAGAPRHDGQALGALAHLAEAQLRAELGGEHHRLEAKGWFDRAQELHAELAGERGARAEAEALAASAVAAAEAAQHERAAAQARADAAEARLAAALGTRRHRAVTAALGPLDRVRGRVRRGREAG